MRITFDFHFHGTIDVERDQPTSPPTPDKILGITFTRATPMAAAVGTVILAPTNPDDHVTSRMVTVTLNGTDLPPIEGITTPPTFPCSEGDTYSAVSVASNSTGPAPPSNIVSGTVALPQAVPSPDIITGVAFAPADVVPNP